MRTIAQWAVGTALAGFFAASPAAATTVCVTPPTVLSCLNHTINAAIAAAGPGAIIKVAPGTYYDNNIVVPPGLDGLQIVGAGKTLTTVDIGRNTALGVASGGTGLSIRSRNVTVKNMTVRNGGTGLFSLAPGTIVTGMNFLGQDTAGVQMLSYSGQVTDSEFHGASYGIYGGGFGTVAKGNLVSNISNYGIWLIGDGSQAQLNKVYNSVIGINASGDGTLVTGNDIKYQQLGILVLGSYPTVQLNKVLGTQIGIQTVCNNCFGGSVSSNVVTDAAQFGILASSDNPGLLVEKNTILRAGLGVNVANGAGAGDRAVFLLSNKASEIGNDIKGHCYSIVGDGNVAYMNQATGCSGSGIYARGNGNTLERNTATATFENGFTVDGAGAPYTGAYLTYNKTSGNAAQGIAIVGNAAGTTVWFNSATLNRTNFCDNNDNGTNFLSNSFADPGGPVPCAIVH